MQYLKAWAEAAGYHRQTEFAAACEPPMNQGQLSELLDPAGIRTPNLGTARRLVNGLNKGLATPITVEDLLHAPPAAAPQEAPCPAG